MHEDGADDGSKPLVGKTLAHAHPTSFPDDDADDHGAGGVKAIRAPRLVLEQITPTLQTAPDGFRWLPTTAVHTNTRCRWLLMAPSGSP